MYYFNTFFLPQLVICYPLSGFTEIVGQVELIDKPYSFLNQKIIQIKFENEFAKGKAILKLKDFLYYQDVDRNSDYIYAIKRVNDEGESLHSKDSQSHLTTEFKKLHKDYDLVMV